MVVLLTNMNSAVNKFEVRVRGHNTGGFPFYFEYVFDTIDTIQINGRKCV